MSDPTLHLKRDELRTEVRSYVDNLKEQVLLLLKQLNVKDTAEFERLAAEKKASVQDVQKMKDLLARFAQATREGELPVDVQELKRRGEQLLVEAAKETENIPDQKEKYKTACAIIPSLHEYGLPYGSLFNYVRTQADGMLGTAANARELESYFRMLAEIGRRDEALEEVRHRSHDLYLWRHIGSYIANRQITDNEDPTAALALATGTPDEARALSVADQEAGVADVARVLARAGEIPRAVEFASRIRAGASQAYVFGEIGEYAAKRGSDAMPFFERAQRLLSGYGLDVQAQILPHLARGLIKTGNYTAAERIVQEVQADPKAQDKVRDAIARAYAAVREFDRAEQWFEAITPGSNETDFTADMLVYDFARAGQFERVERVLDRLSDGHLRRFALRRLAETYWKAGKSPVNALDRLRADVMRAEPRDQASAWRDYGVTLVNCGRDGSDAFDQARVLAEDKIEHEPETALAELNGLAEAEASVGRDPVESLDAAERAFRKVTGNMINVIERGFGVTLAKALSGAALIDFAVGKKME